MTEEHNEGARLFVAIDLPELVKGELENLRARIHGTTWVRRETYHLTLRFIGADVPNDQIEPIRTALSAVQAAPFEYTLSDIGRFPVQANQPPRVVWVGVDAPPELGQLFRKIEAALASVGIPESGQPLKPHITLMRVKSPRASHELDAFFRARRGFESSVCTADAFHLMRSTLTPMGAEYETLLTVPLVNEA